MSDNSPEFILSYFVSGENEGGRRAAEVLVEGGALEASFGGSQTARPALVLANAKRQGQVLRMREVLVRRFEKKLVLVTAWSCFPLSPWHN